MVLSPILRYLTPGYVSPSWRRNPPPSNDREERRDYTLRLRPFGTYIIHHRQCAITCSYEDSLRTSLSFAKLRVS